MATFFRHFHSLGEEHLPFLFRKLHSLAPQWHGFCLQLGVKDLNHIQRNGTSVDDRFVLSLQKWLTGDEACSRTRLIAAIFQPAGGNNQRLAGDVAESFKGIMLSKHMYNCMYQLNCVVWITLVV